MPTAHLRRRYELTTTCDYNGLTNTELQEMQSAVESGRERKGTILVFASGNEASAGARVNNEGWLNAPYTITIGALRHDGTKSSYSTEGAALTASAPGGDFWDQMHGLPTMVVRSWGVAISPSALGRTHPHRNADHRNGRRLLKRWRGYLVCVPRGEWRDCSDARGVCRTLRCGLRKFPPPPLPPQANPNLGWRDVQHILASTSARTDPSSPTWGSNSGGVWHSDKSVAEGSSGDPLSPAFPRARSPAQPRVA